MIPIRDTIRSRNYPVANTVLIAVNILVYLVQLTQGSGLDAFIYTYGLVPARYSVPEIAAYFTPWQQFLALFAFMFLHGGFWHLLGNMWSLYIFGDNVEDRLGPLRYLLFYLLCGVTSGLTHLMLNWQSGIPTIGASGAIAGVMGAYFLLYPHARILTLIPIFFLPYFVEIPAVIFLGIWFVMQFLSAAGTPAHGGGIAWWAHIGGFLAGMAFLKLFLWIPPAGLSRPVRRRIAKQHTPRLQVIRVGERGDNPHLYGGLAITGREAAEGTRKLVNIAWGYEKRLLRISVPPGAHDGTILRLEGLGRSAPDGTRGDLYLRVSVQDDAAGSRADAGL